MGIDSAISISIQLSNVEVDLLYSVVNTKDFLILETGKPAMSKQHTLCNGNLLVLTISADFHTMHHFICKFHHKTCYSTLKESTNCHLVLHLSEVILAKQYVCNIGKVKGVFF